MLPKGTVGCEAGVFTGKLSEQILRFCQPKTLHLVDTWDNTLAVMEPTRFLEDCIPDPALDHWTKRLVTGEQAHAETLTRLRKEIASGTVQIHHETSFAFLHSIPNASLDWIYLDSDHSYVTLFYELRLAREKVKPNGWIMGHDYCLVLPDVERAVDEFCRKFHLHIDILTDELEYPVYVRPEGYPDSCSFNSFAIRNEKFFSPRVLKRVVQKHARRLFVPKR